MSLNIRKISKSAKLVGLEHTKNSLSQGLEVSESLKKSRLHPHFLGPIGSLENIKQCTSGGVKFQV